MAQDRKQDQLEDDAREVDGEVWRAIRYLDPDGAGKWHHAAFIFGCIAFVALVLAIATWISQ